VLLPQSLGEKLPPQHLSAVLLHELIHLRRRDVWVNLMQSLLQVLYWWHPLLWLANARIRRVREEAVDDAVILTLNEESSVYAPTLLEVARLAFNRPLASLGLVGILESKNALRQRIERLLTNTPGRSGLSVASVVAIVAFTAVAVPMGEGPTHVSDSSAVVGPDKLIPYHAKVDPEVFIRNIKARAGETMHATNDAWGDILLSILDGFGIDCTPPRGLALNTQTGELTTQNTSEALRTLDEVVRELNLPGGQRILNPPPHLKQVLIEAQFYQMRSSDFDQLNLDANHGHAGQDTSACWELTSNELERVAQGIKGLGLKPISSPRIQTSHGIDAALFIGDGTNNIQLECLPMIHDDAIELTVLGRTTGKYAPDGHGWPDFAGRTNCAIFSRNTFESSGGEVLRAEHAGNMVENNLVIVLRARVVEEASAPTTSAPTPDQEHLESRPTEEMVISQLVQDGKVLFQLGKLDEAEVKLRQALQSEPDNQAARYYLALIKDERAKLRERPIDSPSPEPKNLPNAPEPRKSYEKLNGLTFDRISYPDLPLSEVVRKLSADVEQHDPDHEGINFVLSKRKPTEADVDLNDVRISLDPGLKNVRLMDVLEAIVGTADHPIKYSILDYGVEFSFKGPEAPELFTRTFKVDPNTFYMGLQRAGFTSGDIPRVRTPTVAADLQTAVIKFFNSTGVDISPPKTLFFNDRNGTLTVRATMADMDLIEAAVNTYTLNVPRPRVTIKIRAVEVNEDSRWSEKFDWYPKTAATNDHQTFGAILTKPQFDEVLKTLKEDGGKEKINGGQVITFSGRQALFSFTAPTNIQNPHASATVDGATNPVGVIVHIRPDVTADQSAIQLSLVATVRGFAEDDSSGPDPNGVSHAIRLKYNEAVFTNNCTLWDGQTVAFGRVMTQGSQRVKDKVPILGDLPAVGRLFRSESVQPRWKNVVLFVTTTLIDPAGNRIHSDDYYDGPMAGGSILIR
jgi:hypothetical protein